jgi:hypothetical protein
MNWFWHDILLEVKQNWHLNSYKSQVYACIWKSRFWGYTLFIPSIMLYASSVSLSPPRPTAVTLMSLFRSLSHHHPKVNVFLFVALESIADMLCSSVLHGALGHGLRATAVSACCASQSHYASGFCRSMCSVVVSSMCSVIAFAPSIKWITSHIGLWWWCLFCCQVITNNKLISGQVGIVVNVIIYREKSLDVYSNSIQVTCW